MKKFLLGTVAAVAMVTSASAADMAARPYTKAPMAVAQVLSWTGFYAGIQGGYGWGSSNEVFVGAPNTAIFAGTQKYDTSGGFAGGDFGYNWQTGAMVLGAVPLALAVGAGAESRTQIGWVIVGGMTFGTLLTLFVVPTAYTLLAGPAHLEAHGLDDSSVVAAGVAAPAPGHAD